MRAEQNDKDQFIEVLRGLSVLLVVYGHYSSRLPLASVGASAEPAVVLHATKLGVYVFFAISGYLIALTMSSSANLAQFYAKRISRIWPLFIFASIVIFAFLHVVTPPVVHDGAKPFYTASREWYDLFGTIFFLEDLGFDWIDGVFWSVLVELKFYFYVGLFAVLFGERYIDMFCRAAVLLGFLEFGLFLFAPAEIAKPLNKLTHGVLIAQYASFFALGMRVYQGRYDGLFLGLFLLCLIQSLFAVTSGTGFNMAQFARFLFALAAIVVADWALLRNRVLLFFGAYSYSIYLFHQMIGLTILAHLAPALGWDLALAVALAVVITISVAASWAFEWRYRRKASMILQRAFALIGMDRLPISINHTSSTANGTSFVTAAFRPRL